MFRFQGLTVQPLLRHAFPSDDTAPGGTDLILAHHFFQQIFGLMFLLGDDLQLLTGIVILGQKSGGGVGERNLRLRFAVGESLGQEPGPSSGGGVRSCT